MPTNLLLTTHEIDFSSLRICHSIPKKMFFDIYRFYVSNLETYVPNLETHVSNLETPVHNL